MRQCFSCAGTEADGAALGPPIRGRKLICSACRSEPPPTVPTRKPKTRASYRAAYRARAKSPQADLVDLIVPPP
jgi:hypothetical protein